MSRPNKIRTQVLTVGVTALVLDLSWLADEENVQSITLVPKTGTFQYKGLEDDDLITLPTSGILLEIDYDKGNSDFLPWLLCNQADGKIEATVSVLEN